MRPLIPVTVETLTMRQISVVKAWATKNSKAKLYADCLRVELSLGSIPVSAMQRICNHLNRPVR